MFSNVSALLHIPSYMVLTVSLPLNMRESHFRLEIYFFLPVNRNKLLSFLQNMIKRCAFLNGSDLASLQIANQLYKHNYSRRLSKYISSVSFFVEFLKWLNLISNNLERNKCSVLEVMIPPI